MATRRSFFRNGTKLIIGSLLFANLPKSVRSSVERKLQASKSTLEYWDLIRSQFTIREGLTYLNNGTMGPSPISVQEKLIAALTHTDSHCQYEGWNKTRVDIARFIKAHSDEIVLTHNTTEGINNIVWGLPLKRNDEVLISGHEHVGNTMPWLNRAEIDGLKLKVFEPKLTQDGILNQLNDLIGKRTRVVSLPHVSCTTGQRFPIKAIQKLCREKGVWFVPDGAHGAGAINLDMQDLDLDFYVTCGHKWMLGPKGTGFAFVRKDVMDLVKPTYAGAYTDSGYNLKTTPPVLNGYNKTAHRYDYGTKNAALFIGLSEAIKFHERIGKSKVEERIFNLNSYLRTSLEGINSVELIGPSEEKSRSMMLGFRHTTIPYDEVADKLRISGFRVRQVPEAGLNSIRVSTHLYNTTEQIDAFCTALKNMGS